MDVDQGIVHRAQNREGGRNFHRFQKAVFGVGPHLDALFGELVAVDFRPVFHRAQQDTDVLWPHRTEGAAFGHGKSLIEHPLNLFGHIGGLHQLVGELLAGVLQQVHLSDGIFLFRIDCGGGERLGPIVIDLAHLPAHHRLEQEVDALGHLFAGAEIVREDDSCRIVLAVVVVEGVALFDEDFRHRLPKAVDTLLDIPDHEEIVRAGDTLEDHVLGGVGVLVFVHQHKGKLFGKLLCKGGLFPFSLFFLHQKLHRKVLEVRKVQQPALPLFLHQAAVIVEHQVEQRLDARAQKADILQKARLIDAEQVLVELLDDILCRLAQRLHQLLFGGVLITAQRPQPLEGDVVQLAADIVPAAGVHLVVDALCLRKVPFKGGKVGLFHCLVAGNLLDGTFKLRLRVTQRIHRVLQNHLAPHRLPDRDGVVIHQQLFVQPAPIKWVGAHKAVQPVQGVL